MVDDSGLLNSDIMLLKIIKENCCFYSLLLYGSVHVQCGKDNESTDHSLFKCSFCERHLEVFVSKLKSKSWTKDVATLWSLLEQEEG